MKDKKVRTDRVLGILSAETPQKVGSRSDFERTVATEHACAVISSAQTLQKASSSSDFERPVATEHA